MGRRHSHVDNSPVHRLTHAGLTVEGYSRGAVHTGFRVLPMDACLDMGACPWRFVASPTVLLSHTHLDHATAVPSYVAHRAMQKMAPPSIYLPANTVDAFRDMLGAWETLDHGEQKCELVGVEPRRWYGLRGSYGFRASAAEHPVSALGYVIYERRSKLKAEHQGLPNARVAELRKSGVTVTEDIELPLIAYTGDTGPVGFDANPDFLRSRVLVMEVTFVQPDLPADSLERIHHKFGHLHVRDLAERADAFANERLILTHFSTRYTADQVRREVKRALPPDLLKRVEIWT